MKYLLKLSYLGKNYSGYQKQKNGNSIQAELECAMKKIIGRAVQTIASGRTDAGVSAICQVVSFELESLPKNLDKRLNLILPEDIRVLGIETAEDGFHARFSAKKKTYLYNFYISNVNIPFLDSFALRVNENLDIEKIEKEIESLIGEHDFSAFCASGSSAESKVREIYSARILKNDLFYSLEITGNGFLYNMVRIIMGTLIEIGYGKLKNLKEVIDSKNRARAGKTVSGVGLVLKSVEY